MAAAMSDDKDYVICGSEDGNVYIWNTVNKYVPTINPMYCIKSPHKNYRFTGYNRDHNDSVEYFRPFNGLAVTSALFAPSTILQPIQKAMPDLHNIILACSYDGLLQVYYCLRQNDMKKPCK